MIILMASMGNNNEIGKDNANLWNLDFHNDKIKEEVEGNIVVMGRNTFNELPNQLDNTKKIVLSKTKNFNKEIGKDVTVVDNVLDLIKKCRQLSQKKDVYIVGGESMFNLFMDYAGKMYITKINKTVNDADAFFPEIRLQEWDEKVINEDKDNDTKFSFVEYTKK